LKTWKTKTFESLLTELYNQTALTFKDSFLYQISHELYRRLVVNVRIKQT
jgi:hypothetical protein